jgi:5'(3')-deoxyribonucleotidase
MKSTLYIDMDGVVADFNRYAYEVLRLPPSEGIYPDEKWVKLRDNERLYRDLEKTSYADELIDFCREFAWNKYNLIFLTAVPKNNDMHWSFYDKVMWANKHFPNIPVHFGPFSKDKHVHCVMGDILIDDRTSNIEEWRAAGGIGIHHKKFKDTIEALKNLQD